MLSELLPFWSKYWHFVVIGCVTYIVAIISTRRIKRDESPKDSVDGSAEYDESSTVKDIEDIKEGLNEECNDHEPALPKFLEHIPYVYKKSSVDEIMRNTREFYNIANERRTIRFFSNDPIPESIIHDLIKTAGTAPSGAHTEPWTFVAISNEEMKKQVREIIEKEEELNYKKRMGKKWTTDLEPLKTNWIKEYLTVAPWLILVFKQTYGALPDGRKKIHYYHEMSVSIACGILITAIQYAGLVTLTSTPLNCGPALRQLLGRPNSEKLCLLLPVGYPAEDATVPNLQRKKLDDILVQFS